MNLNKIFTLVLLCLTAGLISGCESTSFESIPKGVSDTCEQNWPGGWIALDETGHDADFAVFIDKDCTVTNVTGKTPGVTARARFFTLQAQNYVVLNAIEAQRLLEVEPDNKPVSSEPPNAGGYFILRWSYDNGYLAISAPEHRRVASLIINGAIDGSVERQPNRSLRNEIGGTPEQIQNLFERIDLYTEHPFAHLRFTGKSRRSLDQAVNKAKRAAALKDKH